MPWIGLEWCYARYVSMHPPRLALELAKNHFLDVDAELACRPDWLFPGGIRKMRFTVNNPVSDDPEEVEVIYRCVATPEQQGQSYRFAKYYFSNDQQIQWLHVRTSPDIFFIWSPSPTEFDVWTS